MGKVNLFFDQGVPQYVCSICSGCHSVFGKSLCSIKNRGCCWYFPKFYLHDIHQMVSSQEGLDILETIRKQPEIRIYNYYICTKGYFDENGYKKFLERGQGYKYDVEDKSIFFRVCPFVRPGEGCTLPVRYRSYVCNFFICHEVVERIEKNDSFKEYIKERDNYVKWIEWENSSLEMILIEKGLTLANDFDRVINILKDVPLDCYELPHLPAIDILGGFSIGA